MDDVLRRLQGLLVDEQVSFSGLLFDFDADHHNNALFQVDQR